MNPPCLPSESHRSWSANGDEHGHRVTTSADKLRKPRNLGNVGEILLESGFEQLKPNRKEIESNRPKIYVSYRIREENCFQRWRDTQQTSDEVCPIYWQSSRNDVNPRQVDVLLTSHNPAIAVIYNHSA